jgi:hypothetical protein
MRAAFPPSDYYGASVPPVAHSRRRTCPDSRPGRPEEGAATDGSHVHHMPIDEPGAQLLSRQRRHTYAADLRRGLPKPALSTTWASRPHAQRAAAHCIPRPLSTRFEPVHRLRDVVAGSSRTPSRLACRTRPVWQCQAVPSLSGLLPTLPGVPRIRLPSASAGPLRRPNGKGLPPPLGHVAPHGARWRRSTTPDRRLGV